MTTTAPAIAVLTQSVVPIYTWLVVIRVTTSAVRRVGSERPGNGFAIGRVAVAASNATVVRSVERAVVRIDQSRHPGSCAVASIAASRRAKVTTAHTGCRITVVTGRARTRHDVVMCECRGNPSGRAVTGIARRVGHDVVGCLARCRVAVVAGRARARHDAGVRERRRRPRRCAVTGIARRAGHQMVGCLARRRIAVVTGRARARHDDGVRERCRRPRRCAVTGIARCAGHDVVGRLAPCRVAVVAGRARARRDAGVRERRRCPRAGTVTRVTGNRRRYVPNGLPRSHHPVVANTTTTGADALVPEKCRLPGRRTMTTHARCRRGNMPWRLERAGKRATCGVTARALSRRAVQDTVDMTVLTPRGNMRTGQGKSGDGVIKVERARTISGRIGGRNERQRNQCHCHYNKLALRPQKASHGNPVANSHRDRVNGAVSSRHDAVLCLALEHSSQWPCHCLCA